MRPSIKVLTLAVEDLDRALAFYRDGLGLETEGIVGQQFEHGAVVFIQMAGGLVLALWPAASLAHDAGVPATAHRTGAVSLGHNVSSPEEVDAVMAQAKQAGAEITAPAAKRFWGGYSGYFRDPDGHLWEVVWNPQFDPPA